MRQLLLAATTVLTFMGCAQPSNSLEGDWANQEVTDVNLRITGETMEVKTGPMSLTFKYTVQTRVGDTVTAQLDDGFGNQDVATIEIKGDELHITGHGGINGRWRRAQ